MDVSSYAQFLGSQHFSPEHAEYLYDDMLQRVDSLRGNVIADYPVYDCIKAKHVRAGIRHALRGHVDLQTADEALMHLPLWKEQCSTGLARKFVKHILEARQNYNPYSQLEMAKLCGGYIGSITALGGKELRKSATALVEKFRTAMQHVLAFQNVNALPTWVRNAVHKPQAAVHSDRVAPSRWSGGLNAKTCETAARCWQSVFTHGHKHEGECVLLALPEQPELPVAALKLYREKSVLALETVRAPQTGLYPLVEGGLYVLDVNSLDDVLPLQERARKFPVAIMNAPRLSPQRMLGEHPRWEVTIDMQAIKSIAREKARS